MLYRQAVKTYSDIVYSDDTILFTYSQRVFSHNTYYCWMNKKKYTYTILNVPPCRNYNIVTQLTLRCHPNRTTERV